MKEYKNIPQKSLGVVSFIGRKILAIIFWYKALWVKYTYNKYDEFIYKKGIIMIAATALTAIIIPMCVCLVFQTGYYFATYKKEIIYLSHSEEIYPDYNIWNVRGCHTKSCDSDSSLYFRISPSTFHHIWSLGHSGRIFIPDQIGSSVPTGSTRCEVISYGVRMRMTMLFNIYPNILKINCSEVLTESH